MAARPGNVEIIGDAIESLLELDDPLAQRPAHFGQPLAEEQDGDAHDNDHLHRAETKHEKSSAVQRSRSEPERHRKEPSGD